MRTMRASTVPVICQHCKHYVFAPAAWIGVLWAMSRKSGAESDDGLYTKAEIAKVMGISRERVGQLIIGALGTKSVEPAHGNKGGLYRKTKQGNQFLYFWEQAGWSYADQVQMRQHDLRRELYRKHEACAAVAAPSPGSAPGA